MAAAVVAIIAVTAVAVLVWDRSGGGTSKNVGGSGGSSGGQTAPSGAASDVASANDTGPVGIITEDPSCAPWTPVASTLAGVETNGWDKRDPSVPIASWSPETLLQFNAVGKAMRNAADQTVPLTKVTPHRVMRELYGQFIAYSRVYADNLGTYAPIDDALARAASTTADVITNICISITRGSAAARALLVPAPAAPTSVAPVGDLAKPQRIFDIPDAVCSELSPTLNQLLDSPVFKSWMATDPKIPASSMPPEVQALNEAVAPLMSSTADALEKLAAKSSNPIVQDFILLGVQYRRTYVQSQSTYQPSDQYLYLVGQYAPLLMVGACQYAAR